MMLFDVLVRVVELFNRYAKLAVCTLLAVALVWRGNTYIEPHTGAVLAPLMCVLTATVLVFTGLGLTFDDREAETSN